MTEIPTKMRTSVLRAVRDVVMEQRRVPEPAPHEVLIRVTAVGTCGSDTHYYEQGRIGDFVVREPLVLGHEAAGTVVACGSEVTAHVPGTRVALEPGVPCLSCVQCRSGHYNLCPEMRFFATPPVDGAFSEYVTLHERFAYPVPDEMTDEAAALIEPLSVALWACRKADVGAGSRVLITGAGPIGLLTAQTARALGATEVVVSDVSERRLRLAEELAATATVDVRHRSLAEAGVECDALLECSGNTTAAADAIHTVARAGRVVLVGLGGEELALPLGHVQRREIQVTGTFRYANTWPTAIALAASGAVELDKLVTHRFGLDDVAEALTASERDRTVVKAVVRPQE